MKKKRRLVFTLKEGVTTNEIYEVADVSANPESIYFSQEDSYANRHRFPMVNETKSSERLHYNSRFYYSLGKKQKDMYRTYTIDADSEKDWESHMNHLRSQQGLIENLYEDGIVKFFDAPSDPEFSKQKILFDKLRIEEAWDLATKKGQSIVVSVIDTGVSTAHPDLIDNLWFNADSKTVGFIYSGSMMFDQSGKKTGHGTPVSGIIASLGNDIGVVGIAPKCQIQMHMLKVSEDEAFMSDCKRAINNSMDTAKIINCSFGIGSTSQEAQDDFIQHINEASKKMLFVFAAGNDNGLDIDNTFLSLLPGVLKVGALDSNDTIASDSNNGKNVVFGYRDAFTTTKNNGYASFGGTSAAAPQIAGICALILSHNVTISPKKLKEIVEKTCDKVPGIPASLGFGRVNAKKAMERAMKEFGQISM